MTLGWPGEEVEELVDGVSEEVLVDGVSEEALVDGLAGKGGCEKAAVDDASTAATDLSSGDSFVSGVDGSQTFPSPPSPLRRAIGVCAIGTFECNCTNGLDKVHAIKASIKGKMEKWVLALIEYSLTYIPQKAVKGQALADFLESHPSDDTKNGIIYAGIVLWKMMFDGFKTSERAGAGIVLISPIGNTHQFDFQIEKYFSNNKAEYEALTIGFRDIIGHVCVDSANIWGFPKQLNGEFKCNAPGLEMYFNMVSYLLTEFDDVTITHVPGIDNGSANVMAQLASGLKVPHGINEQWVKVSKQLPLTGDRYG
ncbi:hypothetical protein RJ640_030693 [Escallonia rubra]|uniref:RNase H type-1 domain-containing protein n=1 Tax=Escallonia rubra TaxID=112253 RepID=A0AA88QV06_9ASTE|nr:hypothetical protein RJ640_030693 [Escallonia rubra]